MPSILLTGDCAPLMPGMALHAPDLHIEQRPDGLPVRAALRPGPLCVTLTDSGGEIAAPTKAAFFRGLSLLCQHWHARPYRAQEASPFETLGVMLDCSRNAVPTAGALRTFLRRVNRMGCNAVMLYTEDTYEVPGRPYFGYLRGRMTQQELRELDAYAAALGIELIPCIQTLGHMARALRWPCMAGLRDTDDVLLTDSPETYALLEEMIAAASAPFASRRIHIGMDEAYGLGRGAHMDRFGPAPQGELMARHLARVGEVLRRLGLHGMMWSDMYFHAPGGGDAYTPGFVPDEAAVRAAPPDIDLVYWDYYAEDIAVPRHMLAQHRRFDAPTLFAGGVYTWTGPVPDVDKARSTSRVTLDACREAGVREVFATLWGDDGAECNPLLGGLPGLTAFMEYACAGRMDDGWLDARLTACAGCPGEPMRALADFHRIGLRPRTGGVVNPVKQLLYEDPLMPLFEADFQGMALSAHYGELARRFDRNARDAGAEWRGFFDLYAKLAEAVHAKCALREAAAPIVRAGDRERAGACLPPLCLAAEQAAAALADSWQALWMQTLLPFGFEVIDLRLGGLIQRLRSARRRFCAFAEGALDDIGELSCEKLPYLRQPDGTCASLNIWSHCATPTNISWSV